ncbi:CbtA family protein [Natronomonas sp. LN261]|jgi:hypothetical protein|uniref:CbtA family protein n=1 Tax=Natronomonas sp. LN261 TaxID=2750669 RepID=UPI0015EE9BAB|nr:CbtA family protein [Natronomonas sp. LN261]
MIAEYLRRGVAAGAVAGVAYGLYMTLVGNPLSSSVEHAARDHAGNAHGSGGLVSEMTTAAVSAGSGLLWAVLLGGVFAVALYLLEPAIPGSAAVRSYVLAGAGFLTVSGVPWLALPPAAPGAVHQYPIGLRMRAYVGLAVLGAITATAAVLAYKRGARRHVGLGIVAGAAPILVIAAVLTLATPTVTTYPNHPMDLVAAYQGLTVLTQAGIWLLIAGTFNALRRRESEYRNGPTRTTDDALVGGGP